MDTCTVYVTAPLLMRWDPDGGWKFECVKENRVDTVDSERVSQTNILEVRASTTRYFLADPNAARLLPATGVTRVASWQRDDFPGRVC
ncbi:hypothetical protein VNO80_16455 [Phaseolus coccineus]|uniref:Uncharacterized protein n=1 Tax=Phaseolus coccineus TaxID=3886 RepID=A0AAN9MS51_PHACN